MLIPKLAYRNLVGAGVRTWLNVVVLSIAFVAVIWVQGMVNGMNEDAMNAMVETEYAGGHFWHQGYDRFDPLTVEHSHAPLSAPLSDLVAKGQATPILAAPVTIYPDGRVQTALLRGIDPAQQIITIPGHVLSSDDPDVIPGLIGKRMAKQTGLKIGDVVTMRWRDVYGVFDAADVEIVQVMSTTVTAVDSGQVWLPLDRVREMLQAPDQATFVILGKGVAAIDPGDPTWVHRDLDYLLSDLKAMIASKSIGGSIMFGLLLLMGLLAVFDTQVLSIFRRRKEIGTLMALGMRRMQVIRLFTFEGMLHGLLALVLGAIYGVPLLMWGASKGIAMPENMQDTGFALPETLYPSYGARLWVGTVLLVLVSVTIVSFLPTRRIAKLRPTDALKGKTA